MISLTKNNVDEIRFALPVLIKHFVPFSLIDVVLA